MASPRFTLSGLPLYIVLLMAVMWLYQGCKGCQRKMNNANKADELHWQMSFAHAMRTMGAPDVVEVKNNTIIFTYFSGGFGVTDIKIVLDTTGRVIDLYNAH